MRPPHSLLFRTAWIWVLIVFSILSSCQFSPVRPSTEISASPPIPTSTPFWVATSSPAVTLDQAAPSPTPVEAESGFEQPTDTPEPAQDSGLASAQIHLSVQYNHADYTLEVVQQIEYTNNSTVSLPDLVLLVESNRYPGVFNLGSLTWQDGESVQAYELSSNRLSIPLPEPLAPGGRVALNLEYRLALPPIPEDSEEYKPVPFGYTLRQVNLVDWYPFLPPYQPGQGWLAYDPWFFGEHQVYDLADYQVEIEVGGSPEPLVLAASSLPYSQEGSLYRYQLEKARSFVISISPYYQVSTRQVGSTTVLSYGLPYFENGAQAALQYTAEALELYNELFGEYPRQSLSVVVADFLGGMEYDGLYFLSRGFYNTYDGTPAGYLTIIAVHETAHQWWYGRVGNDQAVEPWLDEALCTYAELLYYERTYPKMVDWWWAFRVNFYEPSGMVNGSIYDYAGFRPYRDAVYLRGAQFLGEVRRQVGDDAFFTFIKDYSTQQAGKIASAEDFFAVLENHSSVDLSDLRQQFFTP